LEAKRLEAEEMKRRQKIIDEEKAEAAKIVS
jgi:hypothetical protein